MRGLQKHGFHLAANKRVGMRKAPLGQGLDFLKAEGHLDHSLPPVVYPKLIHQRPYGQSCQTSICERARYSWLMLPPMEGSR